LDARRWDTAVGLELLRNLINENQPPIQWVRGVKRPGREADHSPPSTAKLKNVWRYTSTPPRRLHGVVA